VSQYTVRGSRNLLSFYGGCCIDKNESEVIQAMMVILQSVGDNSMQFVSPEVLNWNEISTDVGLFLTEALK
jgi:hypothetical protein